MLDDRDTTVLRRPKHKERITLYKKYRLIERNEDQISGSWKGTHLLFFFLAFVFGSFCTFCFHVLMYLFDEKCVLFPKLLLLKELRHSVLYDYIPNAGLIETLPVDFVTTHWMDKSTCYLPTYVPLISGIFGLVWTTMFLMFSSGSRTLGLQRSWRLLPPVIVFSMAMSILCVYTSAVTTTGLMDLCAKLSEITGSTTCSYTINVVTLAFERRIRGVFQAIQLTIVSAWLHTSCWVLTAVVALVRVILVIDFRLVRISADLCGNIEKMLERHEKHIRTVSPEQGTKDNYTNTRVYANSSSESIKVRFKNKEFYESEHTLHYIFAHAFQSTSKPALVPEEKDKLLTRELSRKYSKERLFIIKILYDALNSALPNSTDDDDDEVLDVTKQGSNESNITVVRQHGSSCLHQEARHTQPTPADNMDDDRQSIFESKHPYHRKIEWKHSADTVPASNIHSADRMKSNLKDSSKRESVNAQKITKQIVKPRAKSYETILQRHIFKPYPRNFTVSETKIPQKAPTAQTEANRAALFESLPTKFGIATESERSASTSQEMQLATLGTKYKNTLTTRTKIGSGTLSKRKRPSRPSRVSRSQDQQVGDLTSDDDENYYAPAPTKDEGTHMRKKEKQD